MVKTIILAGGKSTRFQTNKMSTLLNGKPILLRTIEPFIKHTDEVLIVTGHYDVNYLSDYMDISRIHITHNPKYEQGMFSSVLQGVKQVDCDILLTPGDYPNIKEETIKTLLQSSGDIRVPVYNGRKGHPIFISKKLVMELQKEPIDSNLKVFRNRHDVNYINVDDEGVLQDIDFYNDYTKMKARKKV